MDRIEEQVRKRFARKIKRGGGGHIYTMVSGRAPWQLKKGEPSVFDYIPVSCRTARRALREFGLNDRVPRPGYERDLSPSARLVNEGGKCEFRFSQRTRMVTR